MSEEETKGKKKEETAQGTSKEGAGDSEAGDKSELVKQTELANAAAERMEKATEELNAAEARRRLGGTTEAGTPAEKKEETAKEYKDRIVSGKADE